MIYGMGIYDGDRPSFKDGKKDPEYQIWYAILQRCCSDRRKSEIPTYKECSAAPEFLRFSTFASWAKSQIGYGEHDFHIDKDLLVPGNKIYGPEQCVFVPRDINMAIQIRRPKRGLPVGVYWCVRRSKFVAQVSSGGKRILIGLFDSPMDAFHAYKPYKENILRELAKKWQEKIDPRAYEALMNFKITME